MVPAIPVAPRQRGPPPSPAPVLTVGAPSAVAVALAAGVAPVGLVAVVAGGGAGDGAVDALAGLVVADVVVAARGTERTKKKERF